MKRQDWPNRISIARILLVVPFVICLLKHHDGAGEEWRYFAVALFGMMAFSDAMDGYLARRWNAESALGRFLDPVGDKLLVACTVVLLSVDSTAVSGYALPSWVPVVALGKDLLTIIGFGLVYAVTGKYLVRPRALGKACTAVQFAMLAWCLVGPELEMVIGIARPILTALYLLAGALAIAAFADYSLMGLRFASEQQRTEP